MRTLIALCGVALGVLAVGAGAGIEHTILHEVEVGGVRVWVGPDDLPGLSREQLQRSVESQLRDAGIETTPGAPAILQIVVTVVAEPACFANIESSLVEEARLERNGWRVPAESWRSGAMVSDYTAEECAQSVPVAVARTVSDFVEMYGAMNPRTEKPAAPAS